MIVAREGARVHVTLNRPRVHNAFGAAMRDELVATLRTVVADPTVAEMRLDGAGPSFCSGGDLDEFGTLPDPATAHRVRMTRSPAWWLAQCGGRTSVVLHGACIGAGIELAALAREVTATDDAALPAARGGLRPGSRRGWHRQPAPAHRPAPHGLAGAVGSPHRRRHRAGVGSRRPSVEDVSVEDVSMEDLTPVDVEGLTGHDRGEVGHEEDDRVGAVVVGWDQPEGDVLGDRVVLLLHRGPLPAPRQLNSPSTDGPHIHPGTTELTRMWWGPSSLASTWAAVINAPFDAA